MKPNLENKLNDPDQNTEIPEVVKSKKDIKAPIAHRPGIDWDNMDIEITSDVLYEPAPDWDSILKKWGFDPEFFEPCDPIKISQWDTVQDGQVLTLFSYKAGVKPKRNIKTVDYNDLVKEIKRHRKLNEAVPSGDSTFMVLLADWQLGKEGLNGEIGTEAVVNHILTTIDKVEERIRELRKIGRKLGTLVIAGMGDIIENCDQSYGTQTFNVELNRRQQIRVARRIATLAITRWSKLFQKVSVVAVGGNHGEFKKSGKIFTTVGDNDDIAIFETISEILSANAEAYGHVEFFIPEDELGITIDISGQRVAFYHGHISGSGTSPQGKIRTWWKDQSFCNTDVGSANILITAHFHHFSLIEYSEGKIHMQCPSPEAGSQWWENRTGEKSRRGTLTFVLNENGYSDLEII